MEWRRQLSQGRSTNEALLASEAGNGKAIPSPEPLAMTFTPTDSNLQLLIGGAQNLGIEREDVFTSIDVGSCMAEDISMKIFNAIKEIQGSNDPEVFVKKLLKDTLNWPIEIDELEEFDFDDLGYDWNSELDAMGLRSDEGIQDLFQIAKFPGWPLGMFVVRFGSNSIFTKGRGMTTPLRNLLRNLVEKVRPTASHQTWSQDQLLFMCHHEHEYFQFARFTNVEGKNLPKLQTFGWGPNDQIRTLCEFNIKHLEYKPGLDYTGAIEFIEKGIRCSECHKTILFRLQIIFR